MKKFPEKDAYFDNENDFYKNEDVHNMEYEQYFYELIGGSKNIYILPFPDPDGDFLTPQELSMVKKTCRRQNLDILYRVSHLSGISSVVCSKTQLTGIMPDNEEHGFYC